VLRLFAGRCLPKMKRSRGIVAGAALLAAVCLVLSQMSPVRAPQRRPAVAILAPGSNGSLQHHPWWDPRGWFAPSVPEPRVLAEIVAAVPRQVRRPGQAAISSQLAVTYRDAARRHTTYDVPGLPDPLTASRRYVVKVTLTNTTTSTWNARDWVLSYHWQLPGGTDVSGPANQEQTPLPADMAPGAVATIAAALRAPDTTGSGSTRTGYVLAWDLYNKTTGTWLSSSAAGAPGSKPTTGGRDSKPATGAPGAHTASPARVAPLAQLASVEQPTSNQLGLEKFYQYTGIDTGSGSSVLNNLASGDAVWSYNAFSNPSRGFATFVRMAYNSLDTSDSSMGFGWSLEASTVTRLGTPLDFNLPFHPTEITLTDGDGTSHLFVLGQDGVWRSPPGVHLFLQRLADCDPFSQTDNSRAWVMTRPDRTQFFFDCEGYQTAVVDRNGNTAGFTYSQRDSYDKRVKFLASITDPSGRHTLAVSYYTTGDSYNFIDDYGNVASGAHLFDPFIIDKVKSITDISGRTITFLYDKEGRMARMIDGDGTPLAKVFTFGYDKTLGIDDVKLVSVTDPRGNTTRLAYNMPHFGSDPAFFFTLKKITDRRGGTVDFAYSRPGDSRQTQTQVTDQNGHTSTFLLDATGRPAQMTNALRQVIKLAWDSDNNVISLSEDNGATTTYTYDPNTGYLRTQTDALANKNGTASTTYTYQTGLAGHVADLIAELTPQQRLWTFGYDANGNVTSVRDPNGNAASPPSGFLTTYTYDTTGQLLTVTDANGNTTSYSNYDPAGYPQTITDPLGKSTSYGYDVRGNVTSVTDALGHQGTQVYDVFGRPGKKVVPKDQAQGVFITNPAPAYDGNDNITASTLPNGATTSYRYNANDQLTAQFNPQDSPTSPQRETTYSYDPAGNLVSMTQPDGNVPGPASSFTTTYSYDAINEQVSRTDANGGVTTTGFDDVGNRISVTDPLGHTSKFAYDLNRRQISTIDPAGFTTSRAYDLDGLVTSATDQNGSRTLLTLDPRGEVTQMMVPHDTSGGSIVYDTTQFVYDQVGNRIKVITPRGVASGVPNAFTQQTQYDADNRVKAQLSAFNPNDPVYNTPAETNYSYDAAGRLTQVSAPPSGSQAIRNVTNYSYFDNGLAKSSSDPWGITTSYDYNNLGEQASRTITSAGGAASRTIGWAYYPDGKLQSRADDGVPTGLAAELVDNSDINNTSSTGTWTSSSAGAGFQGPDYQTHDPGAGNDTFTWNLNIPQDGSYTVYVKYPAVSGAATNASFTVSSSNGSSTVTVDQTQNAGTWVPIGKFAFTQNGTGQSVTLAENASGTVAADAVQVVRDNSGDQNTAHHDTTYTYDPNGNLTGITDTSPDATINNYQVSYDGLNRVTQVAELASGVTKHTTTYGYDAGSNLVSRSHDGATSTYSYDLRNLLSNVTAAQSASDPSPQVSTFTYTPVGQLATEVKPNGNTVNDSYFADWSLQHSIEAKPDGTVVAEHTYAYDPSGNKTQDIAKLMSADNTSAYLAHTLGYTYDPKNRIQQVTKDGTVTEAYTHDASDNVVSQSINGVDTTFNYDRNRLLTAVTNGVTAGYNYDPLGRLDTVTSGGTLQEGNTYDGFDRVVAHKQLSPGGSLSTTSYTYDPLGRKTSQTTGVGTSSPATTDYAYLGLSGELISELQNGTQTKSYSYTPGGARLSQTTNDSSGTQTPDYYTYNDHSDVEAVTGSDGNTTSTYGYTAYGQNDISQFTGADKNNMAPGSTTQPFSAYRYNATRWDSSSGQYDMGFRNYAPTLNQFLTRDMFNGALADMGLDTDPFTGSRYTFGSGNPVSNIELTGHRACSPNNVTPDCDVIRGAAQPTSASAGGVDAGQLPGGGTVPWLQYNEEHSAAVQAAVLEIAAQYAADHGITPEAALDLLKTEFYIVGASKAGTGNGGRADIVLQDQGQTWVWEVKAAGVGESQAAAEASGYINAMGGAANNVRPGFALKVPVYVNMAGGETLEVYSPTQTPDNGAILYTSARHPRVTVPDPGPVTVPVPAPVTAPAPTPNPQPGPLPGQAPPAGGGIALPNLVPPAVSGAAAGAAAAAAAGAAWFFQNVVVPGAQECEQVCPALG
jgi:RHS repeat-associated protein